MKSYGIPKMPKPSALYDELSVGITTRVFAKKLQERRASLTEDTWSRRSSGTNQTRRASFLEGTPIPNSILRNMAKDLEKQSEMDYFSKMKERDEFVEEVFMLLNKIKQDEEKRNMERKEKANENVYDREEWDRIMYDKIQRELARLSRMEDRENIVGTNTKNNLNSEDEKRINRRTGSVDMKVGRMRRPTVDSIKSAIQKVDVNSNIMNVDTLENAMSPKNRKEENDLLESIDVLQSKTSTKPQKRSKNPSLSSRESSKKSMERFNSVLGKEKGATTRRKSILKSNGVADIQSNPKKRVSIEPRKEAYQFLQTDFRKKIRDASLKNSLAMKLKQPETVGRKST